MRGDFRSVDQKGGALLAFGGQSGASSAANPHYGFEARFQATTEAGEGRFDERSAFRVERQAASTNRDDYSASGIGASAPGMDGRTIPIRPGEFLFLTGGAEGGGCEPRDVAGRCLIIAADSELANGEIAPSQIETDHLRTAKPSTRRELCRRLDRARAHLHDNLGRSVSLSELASVAGVSQFHLARYFKLAFGQSPIAYHRMLRLDRAAQFLAAGEGSVAQAAELAGYSDAVALSHAFRKRFGCAPQRYAMGTRP